MHSPQKGPDTPGARRYAEPASPAPRRPAHSGQTRGSWQHGTGAAAQAGKGWCRHTLHGPISGRPCRCTCVGLRHLKGCTCCHCTTHTTVTQPHHSQGAGTAMNPRSTSSKSDELLLYSLAEQGVYVAASAARDSWASGGEARCTAHTPMGRVRCRHYSSVASHSQPRYPQFHPMPAASQPSLNVYHSAQKPLWHFTGIPTSDSVWRSTFATLATNLI